MNWKWLLTAAEPRPRYAMLVAIGVMVLMTISAPVWQPGGPWMASFAAVFAVILSHLSAKLIMRR